MDVNVHAELQRLKDEGDGLLKPEAVVDAARAEDSVLHRFFTWEDSVAAEAFRLIEARALIRVAVLVEPSSQKITRAFVSLTTDRVNRDGGGYRGTIEVMSDAGQRQQLLKQALEEFARFRTKYSSLVELAEVFEAMERAARGTEDSAA